jgi:hypothetical protein
MIEYQTDIVNTARTNREARANTAPFDIHERADFISVPRRILKLLLKAHHAIYLVLLMYTLDLALGIALTCYGVSIGIVLIALRTTHDRNMRFALADPLREN